MNLIYETSFIVMPKDCNYMYPMVFGGAMLSEMDLCAAGAARRALYDSQCDSSVTVGVNQVSFYRAAQCGDIVKLKGTVWDTGKKSITVKVEGWVDTKEGDKLVCSGMFTFVSRKSEVFTPHELPKVDHGKLV